jgi:hypothetical protein
VHCRGLCLPWATYQSTRHSLTWMAGGTSMGSCWGTRPCACEPVSYSYSTVARRFRHRPFGVTPLSLLIAGTAQQDGECTEYGSRGPWSMVRPQNAAGCEGSRGTVEDARILRLGVMSHELASTAPKTQPVLALDMDAKVQGSNASLRLGPSTGNGTTPAHPPVATFPWPSA